jgi:hypothetical protein
MKPFHAPPVGTLSALPIRAAHFVQLAVLTDTTNHIHIALPECYGTPPHTSRTFDRVEDRRFFLDGDRLVSMYRKEGSFTIRGEVIPIENGVKLHLAITNHSEIIFPEMPAVVCIQCAAAPSFADPQLERYFYLAGGQIVYFKPPYDDAGTGQVRLFSTTGQQVGPKERFLQNPEPDIAFIGLRSRDGNWVLGQYWETSRTIWGNCHPAIACLHADPLIPSLTPNETAETSGMLYIMPGTPEDCLARFQKDSRKRPVMMTMQ